RLCSHPGPSGVKGQRVLAGGCSPGVERAGRPRRLPYQYDMKTHAKSSGCPTCRTCPIPFESLEIDWSSGNVGTRPQTPTSHPSRPSADTQKCIGYAVWSYSIEISLPV